MSDPNDAGIRPATAYRGRHVVVCCAGGDRVALQPALELLTASGCEVTALEQSDAPTLLEHVRRNGRDAAYVLAKSTDLHAPRIARLREVLRGANVPERYIVELDIDWRDPMALLDRLPPVEVTRPPTHPQPVLHKHASGRVATHREATGPRRVVARVTGPREPEPERERPREPEPAPAPPLEPAANPPAAVAPPPVAPPHVAPPPVAPPPVAPSRVAVSSPRRITTMLRRLARSEGRGPRIAAGAIALVVFSATVYAIARDGDPKTNTDVTIVDTPPSEDAARPAPEDAAEDREPEPEIEPEPELEPEPEHANAKEPEKKRSSPDQAPVVDADIEAARKAGRLGVYAGIVYAPRHSKPGNFDAAVRLCKAMPSVAGRSWRMPALAELHQLAANKIIDRGVYWSGTEADAFGRFALIWSEKKTRAAPIAKRWRGALALCVLD